eukprot:CAMPEP_0172384030 /NCGR_PEP_ID=MMETSP1061-20121228/1840_1 /TAXON_ID=37318 /ORGANISM="Pseudo-nitzschia pungens, Strain cf. pungens" /LENGTH=497 /DNA_ID=CAMNT_0013112517 /DNA_START=165 /DNA_END=1658 /DNA_ORIENTATION=+
MGVDSSASASASASAMSFYLSSGESQTVVSNTMHKSEVHRVVYDIARAIQSSALLSLLRDSNNDGSPESNHKRGHHSAPKSNKSDLKRKRKRKRKKKKHGTPHQCLADIPLSILDERIKPIKQALERVDAQKLLALELIYQSSVGEQAIPGPRVQDGVFCRRINREIHPKLRMEDDDVKEENRNSVVRYLHIAEVEDEYTIGIFVFGPNQRIPLHDHPEMCVLSRVLYGDLQRLSLDLDRGQSKTTATTRNRVEHNRNDATEDMDCAENQCSAPLRTFLEQQMSTKAYDAMELKQRQSESSSWFSRSAMWLRNNLHGSNGGSCFVNSEDDRNDRFPEGTKIAFINEIDTLRAPDVASLYPYEGNLHEFVAGPQGAAVLDVLLPPYDDDHNRDCTFYHIRDAHSTIYANLGSSRKCNNTESSIGMLYSDAFYNSREPCLIVPTGQPENFHCISGSYRELGEREDKYAFMEEIDEDHGCECTEGVDSKDDEESYGTIEQ